MLKVLAPAKINLVLEVLGKRSDGFHEIRSLIQSVDLYDEIYFERSETVTLCCNNLELANSNNLVIKAARMVKERTGYQGGVIITLNKHIPVSAGLGGGSSDAAATLLALNKLWDLNLNRDNMIEIAAQLGSDVPFFIYKGTALIEGKGEKVTVLPQFKKQWFILLISEMSLKRDKTKLLYSLLKNSNITSGRYIERALEHLKIYHYFDASLLYNTFDSVAEEAFPGIEKIWSDFKEASTASIHLAGSGPTLFYVADSRGQAEQVINNMRKLSYKMLLAANSEL